MGWKDDKNLDPWKTTKISWNSSDPGPWKFKPSSADNRYNEGTFISNASDPVFSPPDEFGEVVTPTHIPCGYWTKGYTQAIVLTTKMYPLEDIEKVGSLILGVVGGSFSTNVASYDNGIESILTVAAPLISGIFRDAIWQYDDGVEAIESVSLGVSGVFRDAILQYDNDLDSIETVSVPLSSGVFRDAIVQYEDAEYESIESNSQTLISGSHGN